MTSVEAPFPRLPIQPGLEPVEARSAEQLPQGEGWSFEPKWDGFRCLAFRDGAAVELQAKSGKPLTRFFPEVAAGLAALPVHRFVVDGELMIESGASFSFDALQMRLHLAERRIRKLAVETPASLVLFDMLVDAAGEKVSARPLAERQGALEAFVERVADAAALALDHRRGSGSRVAGEHGCDPGRRRRQTARRRLRAGRARDDQGQAPAERRLRGRRLPLQRECGRCRLTAARPL